MYLKICKQKSLLTDRQYLEELIVVTENFNFVIADGDMLTKCIGAHLLMLFFQKYSNAIWGY